MSNGITVDARQTESRPAEWVKSALARNVEISKTEAPEHIHSRASSVIDTRIELVLLKRSRARFDEVICDYAVIRGDRKCLKDLLCGRRDTVQRNPVWLGGATRWSAESRTTRTVSRTAGTRVVDQSGWIAGCAITYKRYVLIELAEAATIAGADASVQNLRSRHRQFESGAVCLARALVIPKEEEFVFNHRPTNGATKLVPARGGNETVGNRVSRKLGEWVTRFQCICATEPKTAAV